MTSPLSLTHSPSLLSLRQGSPVHTTPSSSGGRRRRRDGRRRKSSQSEARKSGRSSISPSPIPTSPPSTSSPLSPLPLSPSSAEEEPERYILATSSAGRYSSSKVQTGLSSPQPASETSLSTPKSAVESCSSRLRESASSSAEPGLPRKRLVDSYCDSAVRSEGGERGRGGRGKRGRGRGGRGGKCDLTNETSPPGSTKQVWGGRGRGRGRGRGEKTVSGSQPVSLRDIMAEEEGLVASAHSNSSTAPTSHTVTRGTHHTSPPPPSPVSPLTHHPSPRSLPASRQPSSEYVDSGISLSSSLPRSAPSNPWSVLGGSLFRLHALFHLSSLSFSLLSFFISFPCHLSTSLSLSLSLPPSLPPSLPLYLSLSLSPSPGILLGSPPLQ